MKGDTVLLNEKEINAYDRKKKIYNTTIRVGVVAITIVSGLPIPPQAVFAAKTLTEVTVKEEGGSFDSLIEGLLDLLEPCAKIFGMIAGLAIMTGNGKIGLERLFWLSLGYITARKVDDWISWLTHI